MQIKKRLQLNLAVSVATALIICAVLLLLFHAINKANNSEKIAGELITSILERVVLRNDYMRTSSARAKEQWFAKHEQIGELIKSASDNFRTDADRKIISEMSEDQDSIGKTFPAMVANREKIGFNSGAAELSREVEERLLNQLNMRVYEVVVLVRKLQDSARAAQDYALRVAGGAIISILLVVIMAVVINSGAMARAITIRARRLQQGASLIGDGDLEHRIDVKGDDEFAAISESFNEMAAKLSGSYRELEKEIEERKRSEAALGASEEEFRSFFHNAAVGTMELAPDGRFIEVNERLCRITGYSREELLRLTPAELTHPDDKTREPQLMSGHLNGESPGYQAEQRFIRKDGREIWIQVAATLVRDATGKPLRSAGILQDVTKRREAEERLKESATVLQAANAELDDSRRAALSLMEDALDARLQAERSEEALQKAHDQLAKQMETRTRELAEKEVMLKEIHHRVKNNLQVISSLVGLQAAGSQDETVRAVLRDVTYRVRSMALVHEKLYQSADLARIDFAEYIRSLLNYLWRAHGSAAAAVRLSFDLEPLQLPVDVAVPCGLMLNELAGNSLKHAFRGRDEGEVTVSLQAISEGCISLVVRDDGVGLPPELDWRKTSSLGLRLVQMLAGQLNSTVELNRQGGTEFRITFTPTETFKEGEPSHE